MATDYITECVPYNPTIASITKLTGDRGYCYLHALKDTWIFPWHRNVLLNIDKIYMPDNCIGCISTMPQTFNNRIEVKTYIAAQKHFPNGIQIRNGFGLIPYKIQAGERIAILHFIPVTDFHVLVEKSYIDL